MELIVFGLNHRTAPLEVRERWALSEERAREALQGLRGRVENSEHLILSTCNRTEFYSHIPLAASPLRSDDNRDGDDVAQSGAELVEHSTRGALNFYREICRLVADSEPDEHNPAYFYVYRQEAAIEHLFRLAGGLDSMIVGESQILGQIKDAYATAQGAGAAGKFFHRLFRAALRVGKRVRTATGISEGCITPGQAALQLAGDVHDELRGRTVLVVGSGKIAGLTVQAIAEHGIGDCAIVNRTESRARALADELGIGTPAPWDDLDALLERADLVVSSTGAIEPVVQHDRLTAIQRRRADRPLAVVDLAIPRDFAPECAEIDGVHLFNIDDLNRVIQENVDRRMQQVPMVEQILLEEMVSFQSHTLYLKVDPVLKHLVTRFEQIRLGVMQQFIGQFAPEQHEALDQLTSALTKKLLHFPIEKLKSLRSVQDLGEKEVQFLNRLFLTDSPVLPSAPGRPERKAQD